MVDLDSDGGTDTSNIDNNSDSDFFNHDLSLEIANEIDYDNSSSSSSEICEQSTSRAS